ncbi:hypothetical protein EFB08_20165 [Rufibacter latericius]|uniref:Uncharacterized protein n=1 Tax=Rufibacter latericius TaxID=2487040 RepID=A0A3M9MB55_9BACT|nr:hypothetical protein EFB08_20165 [Rufibacter latericius]
MLAASLPFGVEAQDLPAKRKTTNVGVSPQILLLYLLKTDSGNVPLTSADIQAMDKEWIESIVVSKDEKTKKEFGPKAKDGVIIIELKPEQERAFLQTLKSPDRASAEKRKPVTIRLDDRPISERSFPEPLYFILTNTGEVALKKEDVSSLNPEWIKSINVLKGAEAEKRFKEQGKNGVILITLNPEKEQEVLRLLKNN